VRRLVFALALAFAWGAPTGLAFAQGTDAAKALFDKFTQLERNFDPAAADLYADDALIRNKRRYPDGQVRELTLPADQYKALIRQAMPLAKARGDTSSYSAVTFTNEGPGVRIQATRFSHLKKYSSPLSMLVAPGAGGTWLIREELSESRP